jgi:hypothetical protein
MAAGTRIKTGFGTITRPFVVGLRPKTNRYPPSGRLNRSAMPWTQGIQEPRRRPAPWPGQQHDPARIGDHRPDRRSGHSTSPVYPAGPPGTHCGSRLPGPMSGKRTAGVSVITVCRRAWANSIDAGLRGRRARVRRRVTSFLICDSHSGISYAGGDGRMTRRGQVKGLAGDLRR